MDATYWQNAPHDRRDTVSGISGMLHLWLSA
jgi:hypothetical protein